jgi:hypothetical protein
MEDELGAPGARPEEDVIRTMRDIVEYLVAVSDPFQVSGRRRHVLGWTYERGGNGWRRKRKKKWEKRGIYILAEDHQLAKFTPNWRVISEFKTNKTEFRTSRFKFKRFRIEDRG